ncbi:agmatinase, mitochondrial isoform X2 [Pyrgilauda ruficollis]|uniref:agmatinase, mitochondrial isoform X2 n=1 Tax=Pyrgilauda ruficollis TaxID=221976 RepID=UPI001B869DDC|nr:agmatinase, mitochondrial isoform X2 [Pyrgilauda ruficollis]
MMRLPMQASAEGLDVAFVGVPLDTGTSNRPGARFGPRQIRAESAMVRRYNGSTGAAPFDSLRVADIGDVNVNLYNLPNSCRLIREAYQEIVASGCVPLTLGGDHTITYPILQALAAKATMHGTGLAWPPCLDQARSCGTGARGCSHRHRGHGSGGEDLPREPVPALCGGRAAGLRPRGSDRHPSSSYDPDPHKYCREQGFRLVLAEECWMKSLEPLMRQALEIIRGCKGLNIVGCDLVEVAPMYDVSGNTALLGANLLFEMLCVLLGVKAL